MHAVKRLELVENLLSTSKVEIISPDEIDEIRLPPCCCRGHKQSFQPGFGLLIAYLIPGFVAVWGVRYFSVTVRSWLTAATAEAPTVGGFLYVTVASVGSGMIVNVLRWLTLDAIHHRTGIRYPSWNFANLQDKLGAYDRLVEFY